jgi:predicted nucleic acid-binding protein
MDRDPAALERARDLEREGADARIPTPAMFELWRGVHLAAESAPEAERVAGLIAAFPSAPFDATAAARAGEVDARLVREGAPIDPEDAMIAGIALALGEVVLTRNLRHFSRVTGLRVEGY